MVKSAKWQSLELEASQQWQTRGTKGFEMPLVLVVQESSRQSSADLNKDEQRLKYMISQLWSQERIESGSRRDGDERTGEGGRWGAVAEA